MRTITRDELQQLMTSDPGLVLVESLPTPFYRKAHIPGAINIPHTEIDSMASSLIPDRNAAVVTYCLNLTCQNSEKAAWSLEALGYTNVLDYEAGKQDWMDAGLPVETSGYVKGDSIPVVTSEPTPLTLVSCSLDEGELADRSEMYRRTLFAGALERCERTDGYAYRFAGDDESRASIEAFVDAERRCCSFLQIDVSYGAGLGPIWLTLTGPRGTRQFIETTFDIDLLPASIS